MAELVTVDPDGTVRALTDALRDARPLMTRIGAHLLMRSQKAFREQGRGNQRWGARMTPNVPGIVADLNKGGKPKARRFQPRPALVDTGRLRRSLTMVASSDRVVVGTNVPYAGKHQSGGSSVISLSTAGRANLVKLLRGRPDLRSDLGWLFSKPTFSVKVRRRPFIGFDTEDAKRVTDLVNDYMRGAQVGR